jgi:hypothetical protein
MSIRRGKGRVPTKAQEGEGAPLSGTVDTGTVDQGGTRSKIGVILYGALGVAKGRELAV